MKTFTYLIALLAVETNVAIAACNADNFLRALRGNAAKASPFCSTYTLPPPNQPLPTYISQYPASRVSSGCSCLITTPPTATISPTPTLPPTPTVSPTPTFTPGSSQCIGELIRNGGFESLGGPGPSPSPIPWGFPESRDYHSYARLQYDSDTKNHYAYLHVELGPDYYIGDPYITQVIPALCKYFSYTLSFDANTVLHDAHPGREGSLEIDLKDQHLVYNGPNGENLPFMYGRRSYTFTYTGNDTSPQSLMIQFTCTAPSCDFIIDNISLVGRGHTPYHLKG